MTKSVQLPPSASSALSVISDTWGRAVTVLQGTVLLPEARVHDVYKGPEAQRAVALLILPPRTQSATMHKRTPSYQPKQLCFADTGKHRSAPSTPCVSPSISDISLPDGPPTPRLRPIPLPVVHEEPQVHRAIAYSPSQRLPLEYDMAFPPHTVALCQEHQQPAMDLRSALRSPATYPPVSYMTLVSPEILGTYAINIVPQSGPHVTVYDVLSGLYRFLRMPLSRVEYAELPVAYAGAVAAAFRQRIANVEDPRERRGEQLKGLKRIDLLLGSERTRFSGLSLKSTGQDEWRLHLG